MKIKIDKQFETIIPPLTDDEFSRLKESVLKEGVRDNLTVWNDTLVDGHNRYRIATENNIPFETTSISFDSREHALNWIISNQLGRRNLNSSQIAYLMGKRYETERKIHGGQGENQYTKVQSAQVGHSAYADKSERTDKKLAKEYGVGKTTVRRNAKFANVLDIMPCEIKEGILNGKTKIRREDTECISNMEEQIQKKVIREIGKGTPIPEAIQKHDVDSRRKENDERIKKSIERNRELKAISKFNPQNIYKGNNVTVFTKEEFEENKDKLKEKGEFWYFKDAEEAHKAKMELRKIMNFKFNQ